MAEYPLTQSTWGRAKQDTQSVFPTIRFWVVEMISAPIVALGMYLAIPNSASTAIKTFVPIAAFSIWMLAVLGGIFLLSLVVAPHRQRNEARRRVIDLESERIPKITVKPYSGRRHWDYEHQYLMWAELEVTNTSSSQPLNNVEVQVINLIDVMPTQDEPTKYLLYPAQPFNPTGICWSERFASPNQLKLTIPPNSTKSALIAFSNDSNGMWTLFNAPTSNKPRHLGGARIEVGVSSPDSALWRGVFYIECHPNYTDGTRAKFEFVEWDTWIVNHNVVAHPPVADMEGSKNEEL